MAYLVDASSSAAKISLTLGRLPTYISSTQAPTKRFPWRTVRASDCIHSATVMLPDELYALIWEGVESLMPKIRYAKVVLKLEQLLQGEFFNEYIKRGSILMISEGEPGTDNVFSVKEGILSMDLSKDDYERTGLQGSPVRSGGRKHVKSRYLVEVNLRLPSMLHGKQGFDRVVWAAQNVLNQGRAWIFVDLKGLTTEAHESPILQHHPIFQDILPSTQLFNNVLIPSALTNAFNMTHARSNVTLPTEDVQEPLYELLEYVDLLQLGSPRIQSTDQVDPFISRYSVPEVSSDGEVETQNVRVLKWEGLISTQWMLTLLYGLIMQTRTCDFNSLSKNYQWLALTTTAHRTGCGGQADGYTILLQPNLGQDTTTNADKDLNLSEGEHVVVEDHVTTAVPLSRPNLHGEELGGLPQPQTQCQRSAASSAGFQRFFCAEYFEGGTSR